MILVYDSYSEDGVHERVNYALSRYFLTKRLKTYYISHQSFEKFGVDVNEPLCFHYKDNDFKKFFKRDLWGPIKLLITLLFRHKDFQRVCIIGYSPIQIISLFLITRLYRNRVKFSYLFHSQLEVYNNAISTKGSLKSFIKGTYKKIYASILSDDQISKLVLGNHIKNNLTESLSVKNLSSIYHPYTIKDYLNFKKKDLNFDKKVFGTVGLLRDDTKNSSSIYDLASQYPDEKFKVVGRAGPGFSFRILPNVENIQLKGLVSEEELTELSSDINYLIYDFPSHMYKYTSSGSVLDSIVWGKIPLINDNEGLRDALSGLELDIKLSDFSDLDVNMAELSTRYKKFIKSRLWYGFIEKNDSILSEWVL
ncbi:hypothetical protein M3891_003115 [Vibrio metschnikovii]|nr:hypothetical protein [Vibrio metschnikovii]